MSAPPGEAAPGRPLDAALRASVASGLPHSSQTARTCDQTRSFCLLFRKKTKGSERSTRERARGPPKAVEGA